MESPRSINGSFCVFIGILVLSVLDAILMHDSQALVVIALFVLACGVAALINLAVFPPLFRLLARLTCRKRIAQSETRDDHTT